MPQRTEVASPIRTAWRVGQGATVATSDRREAIVAGIPVQAPGKPHIRAITCPTLSAAASSSRSATWAYLSVMLAWRCPSSFETTGSGTPFMTAWEAWVCRKSCSLTSPSPARCLAMYQKFHRARSEQGCKIWPHLTAVLNLSDRNSDFI